jgi:HK97 family phage prohead protease
MEEIKQYSELELNIKAIEAMGLKVKNNSMPSIIADKPFFQLKDIDPKKGIVEFYYSGFGNKDSDGDIAVKGMTIKTTSENNGNRERIKHLYNHNKTQSPGVPQEFNEDNFGAYVTSKIAPTQLGKDILIEYEYKIITEHSMGYQVVREKQENGANYLIEIKLWEVSSLTAWGANMNTPVIGVKDSDIEILKANIETVLKSSNISDERGKELELWLKQLVNPKKKEFDLKLFNQLLK